MNVRVFIFFSGLILAGTAKAETLPVLPVPNPIFFDTLPPIVSDNDKPSNDAVTLPPTPTLTSIDTEALNTDSAELNLTAMEDLITAAVLQEQWDALEHLLLAYQAMPNADEILIDYAKGGMLRKKGKQQEAIDTYRHILTKRPELSYVKLDLALMLYEDKQYREAYQLSEALQDSNANDAAKAVANALKMRIKKQQSVRPSLTLNYESTDNVNNASKETTITWLGRQWQKETSSLPQSAKGIRYGTGVSLEKNLASNHNAVIELDFNGVSYWDNSPYNEQTLKASAGYKYADIKRSWSVLPFFEQNWLDDDKYNQSFGLSTRYNQPLKQKNHLQVFSTIAKKNYHNERLANRYDATLLSLGTNLSHPWDTNTLVYGGLDGTYDRTKDKELASVRLGARLGVMQSFDNGLGLNAYLRYARRNFQAPATFVYEFKRQDNEYQAGLSLWHNKLQYKGIRPQLNLRYQNIDSNMPAFYSRNGFNYFISIDKAF